MTETTLFNGSFVEGVYSYSERNLQEIPAALSVFTQIIDTYYSTSKGYAVLDVENRVYNYLSSVEEVDAPIVAHAICSYLKECIRTGDYWKAQFLFPPTEELNPSSVELSLDGKTDIAVNVFAEMHARRYYTRQFELREQVLSNSSGVFMFAGCMYSAKSAEVLNLVSSLENALGRENLMLYIFDGMGESELHARSTKVASREAQTISLDELTVLAQKSEPLPESDRNWISLQQVIVIEEATFFATDPDAELSNQKANAFIHAVGLLAAKGIKVVLVGLDKNYRYQDLGIYAGLKDIARIEECKSFQLYLDKDGQIKVAEANATARYTNQMFDFDSTVLIPRNAAGGRTYVPMNCAFHPMAVLQSIDPEVYSILANRP